MLLWGTLSEMPENKVREKPYLGVCHWKLKLWALCSYRCQLLCWFCRDSMVSRRLIVQNEGQAKLHSLLQSFQLWLLGKRRNHQFSEMCYYEQNYLLHLSVSKQTFTDSSCLLFFFKFYLVLDFFFNLVQELRQIYVVFIWISYCALGTKRSLPSSLSSRCFICIDYCSYICYH